MTARIAFALLAAALLFAACTADAAEEPAPPEPVAFHARVDLGEGPYSHELTGYSTGHTAADARPFDLVLRNAGNAPWEVEFCAVLVDGDSVRRVLLHDSVAVPGGLTGEFRVGGGWAEGLEDGPYGLMVVLPGRGAQVTTVWVGEPGTTVGGWPVVVDCEDAAGG